MVVGRERKPAGDGGQAGPLFPRVPDCGAPAGLTLRRRPPPLHALQGRHAGLSPGHRLLPRFKVLLPNQAYYFNQCYGFGMVFYSAGSEVFIFKH